jgi:Family of unknown function (DUF6289)
MLPSKRLFRLFALVLALVVTVFSMKSPGTAEAANSIIECDYYNNAAHSVLVGSYTRVCNGQTNTWGTVTIYKVCITEPCGV